MNGDKRRKRAKMKAKENRIKRNARPPKPKNFVDKSELGSNILKAFAVFIVATIGIGMIAGLVACVL